MRSYVMAMFSLLCFAGLLPASETCAPTPDAKPASYAPLKYSREEWYGSTFWVGTEPWVRVGKDWQHPGQEESRSVRRFVCPRDGQVTVTGRVFKLHLGGDGTRAIIRQNERDVWQGDIAGADEKGVEPALTLEVKTGDALRFVLDKRDNYGHDTTHWDPCVAYADGPRFQASEAFAPGKQGAGGWFYEREGSEWILGRKPSRAAGSTCSAAAAAALLVQEWLAQRGTNGCASACRQELARAERILQRLGGRLDEAARARWRKTLDGWAPRLAGVCDDTLYLELRRTKRALLLSDPDIDFTGLLCVDNPYVHGSEGIHEVRHRNEDTATPGGRLLVLDGLSPDAKVRKLAPQGAPASFWRPDLSFDGKRVLYCMKAANEPAYHLYETGLDGSGQRQITEGDYNDLDPIYAPDGGIVFSTSRCNQYLRCGGSKFRMFILARCDSAGKNIYFISANNEADYVPAFLPDGRLLYTRWEYVDKDVIRVQSLWTVNPDGTGLSALWGNQSQWPDMLMNARAVPGGTKILFNAVGHHDVFAGPLGVIQPGEGMNYPDGVYNLTPHIPWAEIGAGPADKAYSAEFQAPVCYKAFQTPFPVSQSLFLVSARKGKAFGTQADPALEWLRLYLMDYDGNMELLYRGAYNIFHAQPLRVRQPPRVIPSSISWPGKMKAADQKPQEGVLYSADIYEGSGIARGLVKTLRVLEIESQTYGDGKRSTSAEADRYRKKGAFPKYILAGETASSFVYDEGTKRILGTVPVAADGSVHFKVPPVRSLYFQLLDENGRCLQTMRSFTHVMPGEVRGCVGCHETRPVTAAPSAYAAVAQRTPCGLTPPPWGDETISFPRFVQPVLDKHCVACHGGKEPKAGLDLTHRTEPGTLLSWPYVRLVFGKEPKEISDLPQASVAGPIFPYHVYPNPEVRFPTLDTVVPPMTAMSYRSRLLQIATSGKHHGVRVSPEEEARLAAWVDALCPYLGLEEMLVQPDLPAEEYFAQEVYKGLSYPALMCTAPIVHKAFCQDGFNTQLDRLPKDGDGAALPSVEIKSGTRVYRIPEPSR